jgi:hypothetical protein
MNNHRRYAAVGWRSIAMKTGECAAIGIKRASLVAVVCVSTAIIAHASSARLEAWDQSPQEDGVINIAYSSPVFTGVSKTDALAAIKVWQDAVARNRGLHSRLHTIV